jgi:gamma-glutamylcyclotransferase (GGCT)/AIG2-like uncharacterized protein YtfP
MLRRLIIFFCLVLCLGTIIFVLLDSNNQRNIYYFGYGSNMDLNLLRARIDNNSIVPISFAVLEDYRLIFPRGVGSVIPENGKEVYGCLYLLTKKEIEKLDVVEGYRKDRNKSENSYNREWIDVVLQNGKTLSAEIYIQTNNTDINGKPSNSYKQTLVRGASDCSLPDFYKQELEAIETK